MNMILQTLTIGLKNPYGKLGKDNPYQAKLTVSYNDNQMIVQLPEETCIRILELAGGDIAAAAQVQIADFVNTAIGIVRTPMIEGITE